MPIPKTSGFLNNCGVNAALHIILANIDDIAKSSESDRIPAIVKQEYNKLLTAFNKRYRVDATPAEFLAYMKSLENHYAQQVIMGPVLRDYMQEKGAAGELTTIQENGRYATLSVKTVSDYLCKPLGITIHSTEFPKAPETFKAPNEIAIIGYHLENEHFQAYTPGVHIEEIEEDHEQLHDRSPALNAAVSLMGEDKKATETGLDGICQVVSQDFKMMRDEQLIIEKEALIEPSIMESARVNYIEIMKDFKALYQKFSGKLGFFEEPLLAQEPVKTYEFDEVVDFGTKEEQETYDEKLAIELQKEEFAKIHSEEAFDKAAQIQSDEELARMLQEEEYSRLSF